MNRTKWWGRVRAVPRWVVETGGFRDLAVEARRGAGRLAFAPEYRRLRWILVVGLAVRLILVPLTSWGIDTPTFVLSDLSLLYTGTPYSSDLFFNPPVGPLLETPFLALLVLVVPSTSLVPLVPAITPVAVSSGFVSNLVPTAPALIALKLPLVVADLASTLVIFHLVRARASVRAADAAAAVWLLNPLLIWVSAVHGEVDGLAALFLLLFVVCLSRDWPFASGVWLALAIFTKAFPLALLPLGVVFWIARPETARSLRDRLTPFAKFAGGAGVVVVGLLPLLSTYFATLLQSTSTTFYGGMSPLVIYNRAVGRLPGVWGGWEAHAYAPWALDLLRLAVLVGIVAATYALATRGRRAARARLASVELLSLFCLWVIVGAILSAPSPQSENMVEPLALLLVAAPTLGRVARPAYAALSAAGFGLYMTLLGPAAYFYPAAVDAGAPAVRWVNQMSLGYQASGVAGVGPPVFWLVTGLLGGGTLVVLWLRSAQLLLFDPPVGGGATGP